MRATKFSISLEAGDARGNPDTTQPNSELMSDITLVLQAVHRGEKSALEEFLPLVYQVLRRLAA
jgi:hypothetical protein